MSKVSIGTYNMFEYRVIHKFDVGDRVVCIDDGSTRAGNVLVKGYEYTVTQLSAYHGMDQVYVEGINCRLMAYRFERMEANPWLRRKQESKERLPIPIRIDLGTINIPNTFDGPCSTHPTTPGITGGEIKIPSVIILTGIKIPDVITLGIGEK